MASVARALHFRLEPCRRAGVRRREVKAGQVQRVKVEDGKSNIVLQPRLCTLRSYGSDKAGLIRTKRDGGDDDEVSPFFETLSEYIESSKKSQDFETISGRLAMIVLAVTVGNEWVSGNWVFRKMDMQWIEEAGGAVVFAAIFAWFSSARTRLTLTCNTFIDSLIDQIVDGLFYETRLVR